MSRANYFFSLILWMCVIACEANQPVVKQKPQPCAPVAEAEKTIEPSIEVCKNGGHRSVLRGNPNLDSNAFELDIFDKNDRLIKSVTLDVPFSLSSINSCTSNYTVVGFACGGPCYSCVYVPHDQSPKTQLHFSQIAHNNEYIVKHTIDEDFNTVYLHNLRNGKEQRVELLDFNPWQYGHLDSIWIVNKTIHLTYVTESGKQKTKTQVLSIL